MRVILRSMLLPCRGSFLLRSLVVAALLATGQSFADVNEDYKAGAKSFQDGDFVGAVTPLRRAADAGHADAQVLYGLVLYGFSADKEAVAYFKKSALQGNAEGQFQYGSSLLTGEGIEKNLAEGRSWVLKAAIQELEPAVNQMALLGLTNDDQSMADKDILFWLRKAEANSFLPAVEGLLSAYRAEKYGLKADADAIEQLERKIMSLRGIEVKKKRRKRGD